MKSFLLTALLCFSVTATAKEFRLQFSDPTQVVVNDSDWVKVSHNDIYDLYISQYAIGTNEQSPYIHSMVLFHDTPGTTFNNIIGPVKRIFTFGNLDCRQGVLTLLNDWFVDITNQVVYTQSHAPGEYLTEVLTNHTPRNDAYNAICKKGT